MSDNLRLDQIAKVEQKAATFFDRVSKITGEIANRFEQLITGEMRWGAGTLAPDCVLSRQAAGIMQFSTGSLRGSMVTLSATTTLDAPDSCQPALAVDWDRRCQNANPSSCHWGPVTGTCLSWARLTPQTTSST
jgi:hypothetical protein